MIDWLSCTATNVATPVLAISRVLYAWKEKANLRRVPSAVLMRKVDKTGLIAWQSNKYLVTLAYQRTRIKVFEHEGRLYISNLSSGKIIAERSLCLNNTQVIDWGLRIQASEQTLQQLLSEPELAVALRAVPKAAWPKIHKDHLVGVNQVPADHRRCYRALSEALWQGEGHIITVPMCTSNIVQSLPGGIADALEQLPSWAEANQSLYPQFAESVVQHEQQQRKGKHIEQNRERAGFPLRKSLEEFDHQVYTIIGKREVNSLLDFGFIDNRDNVVFIGSPRVGKTRIAISIGLKTLICERFSGRMVKRLFALHNLRATYTPWAELQSLAVVKNLNILKYRLCSLRSGLAALLRQPFGFQRMGDAFRNGVIPAGAFRAHALPEALLP